MECSDVVNHCSLESDQCVSTGSVGCEKPKHLDSSMLLVQESGLNTMLPPCRVCGDRSTGLHYGVISCEACKSFYRRSFKRKRKLRCSKGNGACSVKVCALCRYQKCIVAGMSKGAIKVGRYTNAEKTRNTLEAKGELTVEDSKSEPVMNDGFTESPCEPVTNLPDDRVDRITCENVTTHENILDKSADSSMTSCIGEDEVAECEYVKFEQIIHTLADASERLNPYAAVTQNQRVLERKQTDYYEFCSLKNNVFGNLFHLSREEHEAFLQATGIDLDDRDEKINNELDDAWCCAVSMIDFAKRIPGFREIHRKDQISLLKEGFCEYWSICSMKYVHKEYLVEATPNGRLYIWGELSFLIPEEYQREVKLFLHAASKLSLSSETWAIVKAMTLTFPDRTLMENRESIEHVQDTLIDCLLYTLSRTHHRPHEIFSKIIDLFLILRNITELDFKSYQCNILRWPNVKRYPLVYELLTP